MQLEPKQFASALAQICEEKGISKEKAMEIVEAALVSAYRKDYGKRGQNLKIKFNDVSGDMDVTLLKEVVDAIEEDGILYLLESENKDEEMLEEAKKEHQKEEAGKESQSGEKKEIPKGGDDDNEGFRPLSEFLREAAAEMPRRKFNPESHLALDEAKKINPDAKIGDIIAFPMPKPEGFGRIAAQTAKQVIIQRTREAEREAVFHEFHEKEGEAINGVVQRIEKKNVFIDLGRAVGVIFPQEQIPGEAYRPGMRIKSYILKVGADAKEPAVILSRAHENFVKKLFEMEVPEVYSGAVEIKSVSREAGFRAKIAVFSKESGVDPIGSCVGQKGTRVQTIINELNGEKIDIIEWNEDPAKFISNSLSPAKTINVEIANMENREAKVKVPADQLSLAIGKLGQNVRLAAKLTGWKIDVYSEDALAVSTESPELEQEPFENKDLAEGAVLKEKEAGADESGENRKE